MVIAAAGTGGGGPARGEAAADAHVVLDVADERAAETVAPAEKQLKKEEEEEEAVSGCRICHLADGELPGLGGGRLVVLGCGCRGELAAAHRRCAEAWFSLRGNRRCEICGKNAANITVWGRGGGEFLRQWHGPAGMHGGGGSAMACGSCRTRSFCNLLVACVIVVVILPWFFHYDVI